MGEAIRVYETHPHDNYGAHATVLACFSPECEEQAIRICNHCGEVYCADHAIIRRDANSTVVSAICYLCTAEANAHANRIPVLSIGIALVVVSWLLLWYLDTALAGPVFR